MAHTAVRVGQWLEREFGGRVISRFSGRSWPSFTPDMSSRDCRSALAWRSSRSVTLEDLIATVVEHNDSLEKQELRRACRSIL